MNLAYLMYLHSPEWQALREKALKYADHHCQICYGTRSLAVHHRRYPKVLGKERICDLTVLCGVCHSLVHAKKIAAKKRAEASAKSAASTKAPLRPLRFKGCH